MQHISFFSSYCTLFKVGYSTQDNAASTTQVYYTGLCKGTVEFSILIISIGITNSQSRV